MPNPALYKCIIESTIPTPAQDGILARTQGGGGGLQERKLYNLIYVTVILSSLRTPIVKANELGRQEEEGRIGATPCSLGSHRGFHTVRSDLAFIRSAIFDVVSSNDKSVYDDAFDGL